MSGQHGMSAMLENHGSDYQLNPELLESETQRLAHELSGSGFNLGDIDEDNIPEGMSLEDVQRLKAMVSHPSRTAIFNLDSRPRV